MQRYMDVQSAALHPACRPFRIPRWPSRAQGDRWRGSASPLARLRFASALRAGPGARGSDGGRQPHLSGRRRIR